MSGPSSPVVAHRTVLPGGTIGMLGGGQLGRMFAIAAATMGYRVVVLADRQECPASAVASKTLVGDLRDRRLLDQMAGLCDVVTLEFENLPVDAVRYLAGQVGVFPSAEVLGIAQDRVIEKSTLASAGMPVTPFHRVNHPDDVVAAAERLGCPLVLKTTRDGYDGKGQWKLDALSAMGDLNIDFERPLIAEAWIDHQREISVIVARGRDGETMVFPPFENQHRHHILDLSLCPANLDPSATRSAIQMATRAAEVISLIGLLCVEMFQTREGHLMINEIAPRPHNSGHLTIEACRTSQFEQQVRAVCGLPLGDPSLIQPAAMVNLMGELWEGGTPDWCRVLASPSVHLHLYGKGSAKTGRKMGHLTKTGPEANRLAEQLRHVRGSLQVATAQ